MVSCDIRLLAYVDFRVCDEHLAVLFLLFFEGMFFYVSVFLLRMNELLPHLLAPSPMCWVSLRVMWWVLLLWHPKTKSPSSIWSAQVDFYHYFSYLSFVFASMSWTWDPLFVALCSSMEDGVVTYFFPSNHELFHDERNVVCSLCWNLSFLPRSSASFSEPFSRCDPWIWTSRWERERERDSLVEFFTVLLSIIYCCCSCVFRA